MKKRSHNTFPHTIFFLIITALFVLSGCRLDARSQPLLEPSMAVATEMPVLPTPTEEPQSEEINEPDNDPLPPLYIEALRQRDYPASEITIEQTLDAGANYQRHIAWYLSDEFRIYGLLTIPDEEMPDGGFPTILFLHGFIPPDTYNTTTNYVTSQDGLAHSRFVTFKPDMRGHGRSEGVATGTHFSETYIVDSLNALSALQTFEQVNPQRIGVWGHSNGGLIGLRMAVVTDQIRASVFWAGVVGSYTDILETYYERIEFLRRLAPPVLEEFGLPSENPDHWTRIDPFAYLDAVSAPVQLHHGNSDSSVPVELSISLYQALLDSGKDVEHYQYAGMDHNFYGDAFNLAMSRTVEFFRSNLAN